MKAIIVLFKSLWCDIVMGIKFFRARRTAQRLSRKYKTPYYVYYFRTVWLVVPDVKINKWANNGLSAAELRSMSLYVTSV